MNNILISGVQSHDFLSHILFIKKKLNKWQYSVVAFLFQDSVTLKSSGGGGGGGYGIVQMCVPNSPLFQRCQVYDWPPFFNKKYMNGPIFLDSCVKGPIFLTSWYMHIFRSEIFRGCFSSWYYMNWLWYLCNNQQKMGTKNQRAVYE